MLAATGVLLAAAAVSAATVAETAPRLHVDMDLDRNVSLDADDLRAVSLDVRRIWAPVLDVLVSAPGDLRPQIAARSVRLHFTARTLESSEGTGLGWTAFRDGEPLDEIAVSVTAVRQLLRDGVWRGKPFSSWPQRASRLFLQRALARAVAHELGHYLLRTRAHEKRGLMRPIFTVDEIMNPRSSIDRVDSALVARLRPHPLHREAAEDL